MKKIIVKNSGRVDKILSLELNKSRNQIEQLIKEGLVSINSKVIIKTSYKVQTEDIISYSFKAVKKNTNYKELNFDIDILYEDEYLLVINKPSNLVVHPAPSVKKPTLVDWLISKGISLSTIAGKERYGIVHRIDKNTTGALVIAKTNIAHERLSKQLQDKSMGRYYIGIINYPLKENIIIDKPISRSRTNRLKMDIVSGGKNAKSSFIKLIEAENKTELIAVKLFTGRTHQIRVHLQSIGRSVLGDYTYGFKEKNKKQKDEINRIFLHAYKLYFKHPIKNNYIEIIAPLFEDMQNYLICNFKQKEMYEKTIFDYISNYFTNI